MMATSTLWPSRQNPIGLRVRGVEGLGFRAEDLRVWVSGLEGLEGHEGFRIFVALGFGGFRF